MQIDKNFPLTKISLKKIKSFFLNLNEMNQKIIHKLTTRKFRLIDYLTFNFFIFITLMIFFIKTFLKKVSK